MRIIIFKFIRKLGRLARSRGLKRSAIFFETGGSMVMTLFRKKLVLESISPNTVGESVSDEYYFRNSVSLDASIILNVFNMEKHVARAVMSVLSSSLKHQVELLIVDDGSTDESVAVVNNIVQKVKNPNVRVEILHSPHLGAASRNVGINIARGKYLFFIDADDAIGQDAIEKMLAIGDRTGAEVIQAEGIRFYENGKKESMRFNSATGYPWGKMIQRDLFQNVRFPAHAWFEDSIMMYLLFPLAQHMIVEPTAEYYYFVNSEGISASSLRNVKMIDTLYVTESMYCMQQKLGITQNNDRYAEYLAQFKLNSERTLLLDSSIKYSVFLRTISFFEQYLSDNPHVQFGKTNLELALVNKNYRQYIIATLM